MLNFGPIMAGCWRVWGTTANFNGFRVLAALMHGTLVVGVSQICGVEQRAPPIFGRAAITLGIGPRSSCIFTSRMMPVRHTVRRYLDYSRAI